MSLFMRDNGPALRPAEMSLQFLDIQYTEKCYGKPRPFSEPAKAGLQRGSCGSGLSVNGDDIPLMRCSCPALAIMAALSVQKVSGGA